MWIVSELGLDEVKPSQYCEPQRSKHKRVTPCLLMEKYAHDIKYFIKKEFPGTNLTDESELHLRLHVKQSASSCRIDETTVSIFVL